MLYRLAIVLPHVALQETQEHLTLAIRARRNLRIGDVAIEDWVRDAADRTERSTQIEAGQVGGKFLKSSQEKKFFFYRGAAHPSTKMVSAEELWRVALPGRRCLRFPSARFS